MTPATVWNALCLRLDQMPGVPVIVAANRARSAVPARPYLIVQTRSRGDMDQTIAGDGHYSQGSVVVMVVADLNTGTNDADDLAARIRAHFPKALRVEGVTIIASSVIGGYSDEVSWRVPVAIDWMA